jgi:SAM-dependent methyltransferase
MAAISPHELEQIYQARLTPYAQYRLKVWDQMCRFFAKWIPSDATVLDLGCGHCEFLNTVNCKRKFGMDLNPAAVQFASPEATVIQQDCSQPWDVPPESIDVVFTSNFFEHLPDKTSLDRTLGEAYRALAPGGRLIAMGPNVRYVPGLYWDFFDHYLPLTERSLTEVMRLKGFKIETCIGRFMPYTMSDGRIYPIALLKIALAVPFTWRFIGKQFLVVAVKP